MRANRSVRLGVWSAIALGIVTGIFGLLGPTGAPIAPKTSTLQSAPAGHRAERQPPAGSVAADRQLRIARSHRRGGRSQPGPQKAAGIPQDARQVLAYIRAHGRAPEGTVGGRRFENRERRLPSGKEYREFDIHPKVRGRNRGPERLVVEWRSGKPGAAWYTPDHYRTFLPVEGGSR